MSFINLKQTQTRTVEFGGMSVDVIETPRGAPEVSLSGFFTNIVKSFVSLAKGMKLTFSYLIRPSTVVTQQYPENRAELKMVERYRAQLRLIYNEKGEHNCTGCEICELVCPNRSITIYSRKNVLSKKKEIDRFIWRWDICTFCNFCVFACPHDALEMTGNFESAVYDRRLLIYNLNRYAGPPTKELEKLSEEERKQVVDLREIYSGPIPLAGVDMPGITALNHKEKS